MTSAEQIKALRNCVNVNYEYPAEDASCLKCPYIEVSHCKRTLMRAAIDALEAAEKRIADQQKQNNEFIKNETHSSVIKAMSRRIEELEAQLPKEGEWIRIDEYIYGEPWECSSCKTTNSWRSRYCQNCGARMRKGDGNI